MFLSYWAYREVIRDGNSEPAPVENIIIFIDAALLQDFQNNDVAPARGSQCRR